MTRVEISSSASRDVRVALAFYAEQGPGPGLASAFLDDFDRVCSLIAQAPDIGTPVVTGYRRLVMQRFPFIVIYRAEADRAFVMAVGHQRRDPGFWLQRR